MTDTEKLLITQFNTPLISLEQLAHLLGRTPTGLRVTLSGTTDLARRLNVAKKKIGRRVMFRVTEIAQFIDEA